MADRDLRITPARVGYAVLAVIALAIVGNVVIGQLRGPEPVPDLSKAGEPYAAALEPVLAQERPTRTAYNGLTPTEAACVAPDWVMVLGPERLDRAGIAPAELAEDPQGASREAGITWEEAKRLRGSFSDCGAPPSDAMHDAIEEALAEADEDPELIDCVRDAFDTQAAHDLADRLFVVGLVERPVSGGGGGDATLGQAMTNLAAQCPDGG